MAEIDPQASPPDADAGREDREGASCLARGCLAIIIAAIFVIVVFPALLWTAGIACGSR